MVNEPGKLTGEERVRKDQPSPSQFAIQKGGQDDDSYEQLLDQYGARKFAEGEVMKGTVLKIRIKRLRFLTPKNAVAYCAIELSGGMRRDAHKVRAMTRFELRKNRTRWEIVAARTREISVRRK